MPVLGPTLPRPLGAGGRGYRHLLAWAGCAVLLAVLVAAGSQAIEAGLHRRGVTTGFGFIDAPAGFQISDSLIPATPRSSYGRVILAGLVNTLLASMLAAGLATGLGVLLGLMRLARHPLLRTIAAFVVEPLRNTPVLLQLFLWYGILMRLPGPRDAFHPLPGLFLSNRGLVLPAVTADAGAAIGAALALLLGGIACAGRLGHRGRAIAAAGGMVAAAVALGRMTVAAPVLKGFNFAGGWTLGPELTTLVLGLGLFHASYFADIVRAGVRSVPDGQNDAAQALGLGPLARLRFVILPQSLRLIVPPAGSQYIGLIKNSALAVAIGYPDLASVIGTAINQTGQAIEGSAVAIALYLALGLGVAGLISLHDRRIERTGGAPSAPPDAAPAMDPWRACVATPLAAGATLAVAALGLWGGLVAWRWAVADAVWAGPPEACARAAGACWAVVTAKYRLLLFGLYPAEAQGQAAAALALTLGLIAVSALDRFRRPRVLLALWLAGTATWLALMGGGLPGLPPVPMADWGGLPLTLALALSVLAAAGVLAIPLALARRSRRTALRVPATALINGVRGIPLVVLLLACTLVIPLLLPAGWSLDKLVRAWLALTLVTAAYLAEVLRGGLQAVPDPQLEAAQALGLTTARAYRLVILPQAFRMALPAGINTAIGAIKDTSLVLVVGLYDLLAGAKTAVAEPQWRAYAPEAYLAAAALYFAICFALARYERRLDRRAVPSTATSRSASAAVL